MKRSIPTGVPPGAKFASIRSEADGLTLARGSIRRGREYTMVFDSISGKSSVDYE